MPALVGRQCTNSIQKSCSEEDVFSQILLKLSEKLTENDFELLACVARQIWLRRNKWVFDGQFLHPKQVFKMAGDQLEFFIKTSQGMQAETRANNQQRPEIWQPPPRGTMKLNWDEAIDKNNKLMGVGVVVRDSTGGVVAT